MGFINDLRDTVRKDAVAKGWADTPRTFGDTIALIHSEVSEALEDWRKHSNVNVRYENPRGAAFPAKPCGIPSELADVVIRILDTCGEHDLDIEMEMEGFLSGTITGYADIQRECRSISSRHAVNDSFGDSMARLHAEISRVFDDGREVHKSSLAYAFAKVIVSTFIVARRYDIDLGAAIDEKITFNRTRPHRHGGKAL